MKFKSIAVLLFVLLHIVHAKVTKKERKLKANSVEAAKPVDASRSTECNRRFLNAMGFVGLDWSKPLNLEMCPTVSQSCCTEEDQLNMYTFWINGGEESNLKERFEYHRQVYGTLLDNARAIKQRAVTTAYLLRFRKVSNCKVLARRITSFNIEDVSARLKDALETMHDFFENSYKGFYCAMCNAETLPFFSEKGETFFISKKFCRDIVTNSLNVLLYFHSHFTKYLNLSARFLLSCNARGDYKNVIVENRLKFNVSKRIYDTMMECKKRRNHPSWLNACRKYCVKYHPTRYSEFFQPNLKKYASFNKFVIRHLNKLEDQFKLFELTGPPAMKQRVLQSEDEKLAGFIKEMVVPFESLEIFHSVKACPFDLSSYTTKIAKKSGIDFAAIGAETLFEEEQYNAVKTFIEEQNKKKGVILVEESQEDNKKKEQGKDVKKEQRKLKQMKSSILDRFYSFFHFL